MAVVAVGGCSSKCPKTSPPNTNCGAAAVEFEVDGGVLLDAGTPNDGGTREGSSDADVPDATAD